MKCPICNGDKTIWFMDKLESCYACKGKGEIEIPDERLDEYFRKLKEKFEKVRKS